MVTYGMIGGGKGSFIGAVHRQAIALAGSAQLAAGSFSRNYENSLETGTELGLDKSRIYSDYETMAREEANRSNPIDFAVVVTPNSSHYAISRAFLEQGIPVVCDKPLATSYNDALALDALAKEKGLLFGVTYTYSGYPIVKHAKKLIESGEIGTIRFVNAEYPQEWLVDDVENHDNKQASWRTDPIQSGISNCVGDIGSHIENTVSYITGLEIDRLSARLDIFGKNRKLDDNASIMVDYKGGAKGLYWSSQVAIGHDNDLSVRIYGTKASISWRQEDPNYLKIVYKDKPAQIISRGRDPLTEPAESLVLIPSGHPEGYFEAFSNIYRNYISALKKQKAGEVLSEADLDFPQAIAGAAGVRFVEKCVESSKKDAAWVSFD